MPTLTFGTIRRHIWFLKIFAYAKIDSRLQDARSGLLLVAIDVTIRIHIAVSVSPVIVAVHVAIRVDVAVEIGGITVDIRRVNIAAPLCSRCPSREIIDAYFPCN